MGVYISSLVVQRGPGSALGRSCDRKLSGGGSRLDWIFAAEGGSGANEINQAIAFKLTYAPCWQAGRRWHIR